MIFKIISFELISKLAGSKSTRIRFVLYILFYLFSESNFVEKSETDIVDTDFRHLKKESFHLN
jgi:hypothetical protein